MTTIQELFNRLAKQSTTLLSCGMLCPPLNRWCFADDVALFFVLGLAGAKPVKTFLITIDYRETVFCFAHPKVHIGSMASELMYWQASGMFKRFDKWRAYSVDV
jgi:hypothetical protein